MEKEPSGYHAVRFHTGSVRIDVFRLVRSTAYVCTKLDFIPYYVTRC